MTKRTITLTVDSDVEVTGIKIKPLASKMAIDPADIPEGVKPLGVTGTATATAGTDGSTDGDVDVDYDL